MVEALEHLIRQAAFHPHRSRAALYHELLRSDTYLLTLDTPRGSKRTVRGTRRTDTLPLWVCRDAEMGGVWVPIFSARDIVRDYVGVNHLSPPPGKEFLWMSHAPGRALALLRGVKFFAGITLYLDDVSQVHIPWSDINILVGGGVPNTAPEVYDLPLPQLILPPDTRLAFGHVDIGSAEEGRLLCIPEAGHFSGEDTRKLVRLPIKGMGTTWMPCRHFVQVLRYLRRGGFLETGHYAHELLTALLGFEMYGEAEALCEWLVRKGQELYGWLVLSAVYGRMGRIEDCADLCCRAAVKYPRERTFHINAVRALKALGRHAQAVKTLAAALVLFPGDVELMKLSRALAA